MQRRRREVIAAIREHVKSACPFELTIAPHRDRLTKAQRKTLENDLRRRFHLWADTWLLPYIAMIEKSWCKPRTKKRS